MSKKSSIGETEDSLFKAAMENVTPLKPDNKIPTHIKSKQRRQKIKKRSTPILLDTQPLYPSTLLASVSGEDFLQFTRSGLKPQVIQRLRRGEFTIAAVLDLHGLNLTEAEKMLQHFLTQALKKNWHCVQIIHGKGSRKEHETSPLKNSVNYWLRTYSAVSAFCSAKVSDGGTGALYVLLDAI